MKNSESSVFSLRLKPDQKQKFEALSEGQNKSEIFTDMLETYENKQREKQIEKLTSAIPGESPSPTPQPEPDPVFVEETDQEQEIVVKLDPVHVFMLRETLLKPGFIEETNELVSMVNAEKPVNFLDNLMNGSLYSGDFAGIFKKLNPDTDSPKVVNESIGNLLLNVFVSEILKNSDSLESPVTKEIVKKYMKGLV